MKNTEWAEKLAFELLIALENATYQAFINASRSLIDPAVDFYNGPYGLPDKCELRKDAIYVKTRNGHIAYSVITPDGTTVTDVITDITAPDGLLNENWSPEESYKLKAQIVSTASKAGHLNSLSYEDPLQGYLNKLKERLDENDYNEQLFKDIYRQAFRVDSTQYHSRIELSYKRTTISNEDSLRLWIDKDVVMKLLKDSYKTIAPWPVNIYKARNYMLYSDQSKLYPHIGAWCSTSPDRYPSNATSIEKSWGHKKYKSMVLDLKTNTVEVNLDNHKSVPLSKFLQNLVKEAVSLDALLFYSLDFILLCIMGLTTAVVAAGVYAGYKCATPCYQRFFGESLKSKALRHEVTPAVTDLSQLFQNHYDTTMKPKQNFIPY